jgi:predicted  nucleic acid-binding Zn-ribbon protein
LWEIEAAAREAEQQKKQLVALQERQEKLEEQIAKRLEEKIAANYDRLLDEVMRLSSDRLAGIKDKREREQEMNVLAVTGVEVLAEIEEIEEQAQDRAIKEIEDKLLEEE